MDGRLTDASKSYLAPDTFGERGLKAALKEAVYAMIDALDLFGIGASWGGFESLIQIAFPGLVILSGSRRGPTRIC